MSEYYDSKNRSRRLRNQRTRKAQTDNPVVDVQIVSFPSNHVSPDVQSRPQSRSGWHLTCRGYCRN
jgi:hypothetical protein